MSEDGPWMCYNCGWVNPPTLTERCASCWEVATEKFRGIRVPKGPPEKKGDDEKDKPDEGGAGGAGAGAGAAGMGGGYDPFARFAPYGWEYKWY
jgi:hypothetical protein